MGLEVRGDLLASLRATVLRLVGLSLIEPLVHDLDVAPTAAVLWLAFTAATGTGLTLRLLAQRQAIHTPSGRLLVAVSVLNDLPVISLLSLSVAIAGSRMAGADHHHGLARCWV